MTKFESISRAYAEAEAIWNRHPNKANLSDHQRIRTFLRLLALQRSYLIYEPEPHAQGWRSSVRWMAEALSGIRHHTDLYPPPAKPELLLVQ